MSLVLVSFTLLNLQSCMSIISATLHDQSEESLTDSKLPDTGYLRTKGQESVYVLGAFYKSDQFINCAAQIINS